MNRNWCGLYTIHGRIDFCVTHPSLRQQLRRGIRNPLRSCFAPIRLYRIRRRNDGVLSAVNRDCVIRRSTKKVMGSSFEISSLVFWRSSQLKTVVLSSGDLTQKVDRKDGGDGEEEQVSG